MPNASMSEAGLPWARALPEPTKRPVPVMGVGCYVGGEGRGVGRWGGMGWMGWREYR
jgi:hypothetical protein